MTRLGVVRRLILRVSGSMETERLINSVSVFVRELFGTILTSVFSIPLFLGVPKYHLV